MNTMAIGDKLNENRVASVQSTGRECSSHSIWAQTAVMRFMELFTHSVFFFSSYSNVHISVQIKKYFSSEQQGSNAKILDALFYIVSE